MWMIARAVRFWSVPATLMLAWAGLSATAMAQLSQLPRPEAAQQPAREIILIQPVAPSALPEEEASDEPLRLDQGDCTKRVCWTGLVRPTPAG